MSDYWHLGGDLRGSRVKSFTTAGKNGKTTLRVEIEITDPWEAGSLLRQAQEALAARPAPAKPRRTREPQSAAPTLALPAPTLALPAPQRKS